MIDVKFTAPSETDNRPGCYVGAVNTDDIRSVEEMEFENSPTIVKLTYRNGQTRRCYGTLADFRETTEAKTGLKERDSLWRERNEARDALSLIATAAGFDARLQAGGAERLVEFIKRLVAFKNANSVTMTAGLDIQLDRPHACVVAWPSPPLGVTVGDVRMTFATYSQIQRDLTAAQEARDALAAKIGSIEQAITDRRNDCAGDFLNKISDIIGAGPVPSEAP